LDEYISLTAEPLVKFIHPIIA